VENFFQCCGSGSGIRCFFGPWIRDPGWEKIQIQDPRSGTRIRIRDDIPDLIFENLLRCESGFGILSALDQGSEMKKIGSGIRDGKIGSQIRTTDFFSMKFT
jgi:hypothetical protein